MKLTIIALSLLVLAFSSFAQTVSPGQKLMSDAKKIHAVIKKISVETSSPMKKSGMDFAPLNTMTCQDSGWDFIACHSKVATACFFLESYIYQVSLSSSSCGEMRQIMDMCLKGTYIRSHGGPIRTSGGNLEGLKNVERLYKDALQDSGCN